MPCLDDVKFDYIKQAYISTNPVLRIRQQNEEYIFTFKGRGKLKRVEFEEKISKEEFQNLYSKIEGNPITKKRYFLKTPCGNTAHLDIYEDIFEGFLNVEVEFDDINSANNFTPPDWFGEDVTKKPEYTNAYMSEFGIKQQKNAHKMYCNKTTLQL